MCTKSDEIRWFLSPTLSGWKAQFTTVAIGFGGVLEGSTNCIVCSVLSMTIGSRVSLT